MFRRIMKSDIIHHNPCEVCEQTHSYQKSWSAKVWFSLGSNRGISEVKTVSPCSKGVGEGEAVLVTKLANAFARRAPLTFDLTSFAFLAHLTLSICCHLNVSLTHEFYLCGTAASLAYRDNSPRPQAIAPSAPALYKGCPPRRGSVSPTSTNANYCPHTRTCSTSLDNQPDHLKAPTSPHTCGRYV